MNPDTSAIELAAVTVEYGITAGEQGRGRLRRGAVVAVRDVDLRVASGQFIGLSGPNGGGKSTLLKTVLGLVRPASGHVSVFGGTPVNARHRVGWLPQTAGGDLAFPVCVRDVVAMGRLRATWLPQWLRADDRRAIDEAMEQVEITDLATRPIGTLSGGQRQRTLLARALVSDPELLLLDEPTAGLDPDATHALYRLLGRLRGGRTIVMASHDVTALAERATAIFEVDGRLAPVGSSGHRQRMEVDG